MTISATVCKAKKHSYRQTKDGALTAVVLRELLDYDRKMGVFMWLERDRKWFGTDHHCRMWNTRFAGNVAGSIKPLKRGPRRYIMVIGTSYIASRLAYLHITGNWPAEYINHINKNTLDDRWRNLRPATNSQNLHNRGAQINNTSGYKGVWWHRQRKKYAASINVDGRKISLGLFTSALDASRAYEATAKKLVGDFYRGAQ